jgi:hypothetical protein
MKKSITIILYKSINAQAYRITGEIATQNGQTANNGTLVHNKEFIIAKELIEGFIPEESNQDWIFDESVDVAYTYVVQVTPLPKKFVYCYTN